MTPRIRRAVPVDATPPLPGAGLPPMLSRAERLRETFPGTVELLLRRRADLVPEGFLADYVSLHWLEWHGGTLRLTVTGMNVCEQLRARMRVA